MNGFLAHRAFAVVAVLSLAAAPARARQDGVLPINDPIQLFLERQQAAGRLHAPELSQLPLSGARAAALLDSLEASWGALSAADQRRLDRFRARLDHPGAAALRRLVPGVYRNGRDLVSAETEEWAIRINPIAIAAWGQGVRTSGRGADDTPSVMQNRRGLRVSGRVDPGLFFEARFTEGQERVVEPAFRNGSAPRYGMVTIEKGDTYDAFQAMGVLGFRTRYLEVRAGRDHARWGPAMSSVSLSNYAAPYDQVQLRARFWRLSYTSLFAGFSSTKAPGAGAGDQVRRRKYGSLHRLDLALPGRVQFGLFESVVFATDTMEVRERFDWTYANPLIFLRAAERDRGSPDNAMLGSSLSWVPMAGLRLYGELLLDELSLGQVGKQWWGNKFAWVAGAHVADLPVTGFQARYEFSRVRPYTYAHEEEIDAFTHFGDPLGFPGGANAIEHGLWIEWLPSERISTSLAAVLSRQGRDAGGVNYGADPTRSYDQRAGSYDQAILQGVLVKRVLVEGQIGYEALPGLVLEGAIRVSSTDDVETGTDRWVTPFVQLRWGLPFPWTRY